MEHVQRWTLKGVFPFFHCASAGVPKSLAYFSFFLEAAVCLVVAGLSVNQDDINFMQ
ncbi:hypothetical protein [Brevibacillus brevis]|uniref:hypothetical protein n=1 Tax=Brevibacillus brevis TaxID=1393 RepID=UPI001FCFCBAB|nr:hypothetical protein [Brevibacillus brevis]